MSRKITRSTQKKGKLKTNEDDDEQEVELPKVGDNEEEDVEETQTPKRGKSKKKELRKQRKEQLKSKTTGVGLKISVDNDSAPTNKKIVFDDTNLPSDEDHNDDNENEQSGEKLSAQSIKQKDEDNDDDDDDAVEEVQGKAARDEVMDQMKTEEKQSLKTKKKRRRKSRKLKTKQSDDDNDNDDDDMDEDFFAQLDTVRKEELKEKKELEKSLARDAAKGKHTTFVFAQNESDDRALSDPMQINENIQVVVLNESSEVTGGNNNSFVSNSSVSKTALLYSRNALKDGSDPNAGVAEMKRKRNRSGAEVQPWKRARQRVVMGRSRMTKGKPAAFFRKKKR
mmetsp:Transcript_111922/g.229164  ORF Transcript_111922/g.229164 Transcript_111922/m.229164 type:complete len:339 (+) Transcript_111922:128-1144(+)